MINSKNLLVFQSIITLFFGTVLILFPDFLNSLYAAPDTEYGVVAILMTRLYGVLLLGTGIGGWIARNDPNPKAWVWNTLVTSILEALFFGHAATMPAFKALHWLSFALVFILAVWSAYLIFIKKAIS